MIKIKVTEDHIKHDRKGNCICCPIALAITEAIGIEVKVGRRSVNINGQKYFLPLTARRFIINFDFYKEVKPFEFELDYDLPTDTSSS